MDWSLSHLLNLIEFRSESWHQLDIDGQHGLSVRRAESVFLYAVLHGKALLASGGAASLDLAAGDIAIVTSGSAHTIRTREGSASVAVPQLVAGTLGDEVADIAVGTADGGARLLCGRLVVKWPGGSRPKRLPSLISTSDDSLGLDLQRIAANAHAPGGCGMMTHVAAVMFVGAFLANKRCLALLKWDLNDAITRAQLLIEHHFSEAWTVDSLAHEVGMSRSNFAARFLEQTGRTSNVALIGQRMAEADKLLRTSALKISEISERVGYKSEAAFIRRYSLYFGVTPGRRRHAKPVAAAPC